MPQKSQATAIFKGLHASLFLVRPASKVAHLAAADVIFPDLAIVAVSPVFRGELARFSAYVDVAWPTIAASTQNSAYKASYSGPRLALAGKGTVHVFLGLWAVVGDASVGLMAALILTLDGLTLCRVYGL